MVENNYTKIKQTLFEEIDKGLDDILQEGFGKIDVTIDCSRDLFRIEVSPHRRINITSEGKIL